MMARVVAYRMPAPSRRSVHPLPTAVLGHQFRKVALLKAALTHPSSTDHSEADLRLAHQRLEFLGDAVWNFYVSEALTSLWPKAPEGELTLRRAQLISAGPLAGMAKAHGILPLILLSKGEESSGGRERVSILSSVFEAVLGAIYLDDGAEQIRRLARAECGGECGEKEITRDPKTELQQVAQSHFRQAPRYRLIHRSGPAHAPRFEVEVRIGQSPLARGIGPSRREAERHAALLGLPSLHHLLSTISGSDDSHDY